MPFSNSDMPTLYSLPFEEETFLIVPGASRRLVTIEVDGPYNLWHRFSKAPIIFCATSSKNSDATFLYNGDLKAKSMSKVSHTESALGPSSNRHVESKCLNSVDAST